MMKKFLTLLLMIIFGLSLFAQVDHDFNINDRVPIVKGTITKDLVPVLVVKAVNTQFDKNNVVTWSKFPFALKEYGWVYDVGTSDLPLDRYEVKMKTSAGDDFWAVYSAKGELVETREILKNIGIPHDIQEKLANSQYKGWTVLGDKEIIRYYHDHDFSKVEQHFRISVAKDNVKRSISFNYKGDNRKM